MELTNFKRELRDMIFCLLVYPRWARGWNINNISWFAQTQSDYMNYPNEVNRLLKIIHNIGFKKNKPDFGIKRYIYGSTFISNSFFIKHNNNFTIIAPGTKRRTNRWPKDRFIEIGKFLIKNNRPVVLIGGEDEKILCNIIKEALSSDLCINLAGDLSIIDSMSIINNCNLVICVDSGIQHIASALDKPLISLFSSWQVRGKWNPSGPESIVLQPWVACHSCNLQNCPYDNFCMKLISSELVINKISDVLKLN